MTSTNNCKTFTLFSFVLNEDFPSQFVVMYVLVAPIYYTSPFVVNQPIAELREIYNSEELLVIHDYLRLVIV